MCYNMGVCWRRESVKDIATTTTSRVEVIKQAKALKIQKLRCPSSISFHRYTSRSRKSISFGAGLHQVCWLRENVKDIATTTTSREEVIKQAKALKIQKLRCPSTKGLRNEVAEQSLR
ncbi:hypothetical protein Glove_35g19 [Diversispora epigaea]|uniref:Uncharacterized protein n=1 Tax=Diversispora epigaea TaxID=1348612 RepID=A0A397JGJ1_9GLOM|nr:hypothetical protein Glove_35g19 [Diversispora epigaea]